MWNRRWLLAVGALTIATLLVVATPGLASDEVPLKGSATSTFQSYDPDTQTAHHTIAGTSTHLGLLSGDAYVRFVFDPAPRPVSAEVHMVAANGDELVLDQVMATMTYTILGGTGRFEGATGSGSFTAAGSGNVTLVWDGTIDFKD